MIKNFVGRLSGKGSAPKDGPAVAPARQNSPPHSNAGKAHVGGERDTEAKGGRGKSGNKRRSNGASKAAQPWTVDQFPV